jgi:DNA-directed RNA polymerase subunit RPC12/RpoP
MSDQFICISCWKEFSAQPEEVAQRGGQVICPFCGYVQPAPAGLSSDAPLEIQSVGKLSESGQSNDRVAEEITWSSVPGSRAPDDPDDADDEDDLPITEDDEHTDRVEIPANFMELNSPREAEEFPMDAVIADEKTPVEELRYGRMGEVLVQEPSDGVLLREAEAAVRSNPIDWQLRTPSGLTFKFTDPEALLGWKKKLSTYKTLDVSPDGQRWVDFARFVRQYEEVGDALRAFVLSERLGDEDLPPPKPVKADEDDEGEIEAPSAEETTAKRPANRTATGAQFTFKVKEEESAGWGKALFFAILGLGLGAGILLAVLHFTGIFKLPIELPFP